MAAAELDDLLAAGDEAMAAGQWGDARAAFEAALKQHPVAEALAGLADVMWWQGETKDAIKHGERAYAAFRRRPNPLHAAQSAIGLYFLYRISLGNTAAARGWLGRLSRLVEEADLAPLAGWVLLLRAHDSDDAAAARRWAQQASELARRFADPDLELCALSQLGAALVQLGRLAEGGALLDEAMAASLGGECRRLNTVVYTSCNMISSCSRVAEVERATQWIRAADGFTRRYGCAHLYTHCRTYHGAVLFAAGDWGGAEKAFREALRIGQSAERALYGEALAGLAQLRLAQGRIEEAERLLDGFDDHVASTAALAVLRLARNDPATAARMLRRRLLEVDERRRDRTTSYRAGAAICLDQAELLELLSEAEIEIDCLDEAAETVRRMAALPTVAGHDLIVARTERAHGRVLAAGGDVPTAVRHLERALAGLERLEMPYEAARTHLILAPLTADRDRPAAVAEARAALAGFDALGASRDADAAATLLRSWGERATRGGRNTTEALTKREREVLLLLGEGLSNRELADRLFLSRKTIEHHVRGVLTKLGLRSRAEAAAYAVRHVEGESATS
ncbi:LuxR C-terminal-related transcriptional regulator [Streptomyces sediminimaris]|uniref:LuxR C-terminal-related transcriptional regulator n=1 Tax=Streptomyces sediminimaris TaxID=3383721 RepID=UPI00399A678E